MTTTEIYGPGGTDDKPPRGDELSDCGNANRYQLIRELNTYAKLGIVFSYVFEAK